MVGILGGGQLARMLAPAGAPLGLRFRVVDSVADACAGQVAPLLLADYTDLAALAGFAREVEVATFDFENVPAQTAHWLAERVKVFPNPRALALAQDRLAEKELFRKLGMDTPAFEPVDSRAELEQAVRRIGCPAILKTRRLGYDGKGQFRLRAPGDVEAAWRALGGAPLILEAFVPFEREVSVVAVRGRDGEFRTWPLTQNWHAEGILSASLAPAPQAPARDGAQAAPRAGQDAAARRPRPGRVRVRARARGGPHTAEPRDSHTSIFVRTRLITSVVNPLVEVWPPRSGVRTPAALASRTDS